MSDDPRDAMIRDAASSYNQPPETPRDLIWAAVQARRAGVDASPEASEPRPKQPARILSLPSWTWIPVAAAAVLAVGIGLGRLSAPTDAPRAPETAPTVQSPVTASAEPAPDALPAVPDRIEPLRRRSEVPYRLAATEYLSRTETFLTQVRTDPSSHDAETADWARMLLSETRLLMDSPAGRDPGLQSLLLDLELVLASIVQVSHTAPTALQRETVDAGLQNDILARVRTRIPAGASVGS